MGAYKLLINGEMVDGDLSMDVVNPATEEKLADCPRASEGQLNAAVAAAKAAFPAWSKTDVDERKALVLKIADVIEANATELVQLLTKEQGKPLEAATVEVYGMAAFCRYFTSLDCQWKCSKTATLDGLKFTVTLLGSLVRSCHGTFHCF